MHKESVDSIELCIKIGEECAAEATDLGLDGILGFWRDDFIYYGKQHLEPVKRFGRYPTRNKALGRENTKEEEEFLSGADGWGQ